MRFNIWDVIEKVEDWWPWNGKDTEDSVNPDLNPVLLVPGIGGSLINAVNEKGKSERIWVRLFAADREFRTKLYSLYDRDTGRTESIDKTITIDIPDDRFGLYACDILDPSVILRLDAVYYFHDLIKEMLSWGYKEGTTLFGFPYDFRQSNRLPERMEALKVKLKMMYEASGGKKVNIVSHSMGGLIIKSFVALHPEFFEQYVNTWIAVTVPFQGAPGFIMDCLLTGVEFVKGWQRELFVAKWSMHQLLIECPAIYELMAATNFNWNEIPELRIWRQRTDNNGLAEIGLEAFGPEDCIDVMMAALKDNKLDLGNGETIPAPFNKFILEWAMETRRILETAKLPEGVIFYNVFGIGFETPLHVCYGCEESPIEILEEILQTEGEFDCVDGDGTVPVESAMADQLNAKARVGIPGDHRAILNDERLFRILKHWLKVGDPDPFYDPLNDYVILPTKAEFEEHKRQLVLFSTQPGESDEPSDEESGDEDYVSLMEKEYVSIIATDGSAGDIRAEAHARVTRPHPWKQSDSRKENYSIEIDTVGVAEGADAQKTATALDQAVKSAAKEALIANTRGKKTRIFPE
ncbi:unnamed protein product [Calypogeia fissa]